MRVASFILPYNHPQGPKYAVSHQYARARLLEAFGGYTATECAGAWRDDKTGKVYSDTSLRYDVAYDWQGGDLKTFTDIAREAGALQPQSQTDGKASPGQICVLVIDPWGNVTLPDCKVTPKDGYSHTRI